MPDSHLNSVHLPPDRRQVFRHARQALLGERGQLTVQLEGCSTCHRDAALAGRTIPSGWFLLTPTGKYPLQVGVNTVGRLADNDVVVADPMISRRHCAILVHAGRHCEVHDTASRNGTEVNGQRITGPRRLRPGDEIRICNTRFVLSRVSDPSPSLSCHDTEIGGPF